MSKLDLNALNELPKVDRILALAETGYSSDPHRYRLSVSGNLPLY